MFLLLLLAGGVLHLLLHLHVLHLLGLSWVDHVLLHHVGIHLSLHGLLHWWLLHVLLLGWHLL